MSGRPPNGRQLHALVRPRVTAMAGTSTRAWATYRELRALSAPLTSTNEGCLGVRSSGAAVGLERTAGNRPDTVQHVVGERNEQSGSISSAAAED
jgi:hypothetical protein